MRAYFVTSQNKKIAIPENFTDSFLDDYFAKSEVIKLRLVFQNGLDKPYQDLDGNDDADAKNEISDIENFFKNLSQLLKDRTVSLDLVFASDQFDDVVDLLPLCKLLFSNIRLQSLTLRDFCQAQDEMILFLRSILVLTRSSLTALSLQDCFLDPGVYLYLAKALKGRKRLESFTICGEDAFSTTENYSKDEEREAALILANNRHLKYLSIKYMRLTAGRLGVVLKALETNTSLRELNFILFDYIRFSDTIMMAKLVTLLNTNQTICKITALDRKGNEYRLSPEVTQLLDRNQGIASCIPFIKLGDIQAYRFFCQLAPLQTMKMPSLLDIALYQVAVTLLNNLEEPAQSILTQKMLSSTAPDLIEEIINKQTVLAKTPDQKTKVAKLIKLYEEKNNPQPGKRACESECSKPAKRVEIDSQAGPAETESTKLALPGPQL